MPYVGYLCASGIHEWVCCCWLFYPQCCSCFFKYATFSVISISPVKGKIVNCRGGKLKQFLAGVDYFCLLPNCGFGIKLQPNNLLKVFRFVILLISSVSFLTGSGSLLRNNSFLLPFTLVRISLNKFYYDESRSAGSKRRSLFWKLSVWPFC